MTVFNFASFVLSNFNFSAVLLRVKKYIRKGCIPREQVRQGKAKKLSEYMYKNNEILYSFLQRGRTTKMSKN